MEASAQSPLAEQSGGVGSGRAQRQTQPEQKDDEKAEGEVQRKENGAKSSLSSFGRLPRNVIERYVVGLFFLRHSRQHRNSSKKMCMVHFQANGVV